MSRCSFFQFLRCCARLSFVYVRALIIVIIFFFIMLITAGGQNILLLPAPRSARAFRPLIKSSSEMLVPPDHPYSHLHESLLLMKSAQAQTHTRIYNISQSACCRISPLSLLLREQSHSALFISPEMFDLTRLEDKLKERPQRTLF